MVPLITNLVIQPKGINVPATFLEGQTPDEIVVHETANIDETADALMHNRFVRNGGGYEKNPPGVSFTWGVDEFRAVQNTDERRATLNAGDGSGPGNYNALSIETCVNMMRDPDPVRRQQRWLKTLRNLAQLIALKMVQYKIPIERVRQHNHYSSYKKDCPHYMRMGGGVYWRVMLDMVREELALLQKPVHAPVPRPVPAPVPSEPRPEPTPYATVLGTPYKVGMAIGDFWKANGRINIFGLPISDEIKDVKLENGKLYTVQKFERAWLHWRDGEGVGIVRLGVLYDELLKKAA